MKYSRSTLISSIHKRLELIHKLGSKLSCHEKNVLNIWYNLNQHRSIIRYILCSKWSVTTKAINGRKVKPCTHSMGDPTHFHFSKTHGFIPRIIFPLHPLDGYLLTSVFPLAQNNGAICTIAKLMQGYIAVHFYRETNMKLQRKESLMTFSMVRVRLGVMVVYTELS